MAYIVVGADTDAETGELTVRLMTYVMVFESVPAVAATASETE